MEEQHNIPSEPNSSMEELKLEEDENIKEISLEEDILGTQSLLMSESDEDAGDDLRLKGNESPQKKIHFKRSRRLLDSDDDLEDAQMQSNNEENVINKKKISALIDSDSDDDKITLKDENDNQTGQLKPTQADDVNPKPKNIKKQKKNSRSKTNLQEKKIRVGGTKKVNKKKAKYEQIPNLEDIKDYEAITKKGVSLVDTDPSPDESAVSDSEDPTKNTKHVEPSNVNSTEKNKTSKVVRVSKCHVPFLMNKTNVFTFFKRHLLRRLWMKCKPYKASSKDYTEKRT